MINITFFFFLNPSLNQKSKYSYPYPCKINTDGAKFFKKQTNLTFKAPSAPDPTSIAPYQWINTKLCISSSKISTGTVTIRSSGSGYKIEIDIKLKISSAYFSIYAHLKYTTQLSHNCWGFDLIYFRKRIYLPLVLNSFLQLQPQKRRTHI